MIKKDVLKKINDQIQLEYESAFIYKQMSIDMAIKGWNGFAHWFDAQYKEEIAHAEEMINYVIMRGETPVLHDIKTAESKLEGVVAYFEKAYEHECFVSKSINEIVAAARKENDYATENFFRRFVDEQVEEEDTVAGIVDRLKLANGDAGYLIIDGDLATRQ